MWLERTMSLSPQDLLHSFDVLPQPEQRLVLTEICRRAAQWDADPLSDDELVREADAVFQMLDQREQDADSAAG
jgi:hypothetical protein